VSECLGRVLGIRMRKIIELQAVSGESNRDHIIYIEIAMGFTGDSSVAFITLK